MLRLDTAVVVLHVERLYLAEVGCGGRESSSKMLKGKSPSGPLARVGDVFTAAVLQQTVGRLHQAARALARRLLARREGSVADEAIVGEVRELRIRQRISRVL